MIFNGTNRYDSISTYAPSSPGTVMYWILTNSITGVYRIVGGDNAYESRTIDADMYHEYYQSASVFASGVTTGAWHHYGFTWDGTNKGMYRDGVLLGEIANAHATPPTTNLSLGASYWTPGTEQLDGQLDDVRIYNRKVSAPEFAAIYNSHGGDGIVFGLLHRWALRSAPFGSGSSSEVDVRGSLNMSATPGNPTMGSLISRMRRG